MKQSEMPIPHLFRCPISLDLFKDPVTLCTGQTYDRSSIEKWLADGNLTCPVTMQKLHDVSMVPNHTLRHLIDQWLQKGPRFDPYYLTTVDLLTSLKHDLESHDVILEKKLQTLRTIQTLSEESPSKGSYMLQLGFLPLLLRVIFGEPETGLSEERFQFVEPSLSCVLKLLSLEEFESLNMLKEESKLKSFQHLFDLGTGMIKVSLCHLIDATSSSPVTRGLCSMLGERQQLLHSLVVHAVHQNYEVSEAAVKAISAMCSLESNREHLVQAGGMNVLLTYISDAERHQRRLNPKAMATIEQLLLALESAKEAVISDPNGVSTLVKMVFRVSDHEGSESAVRSLIVICTDSLQAREDAICAGVLTQLLLLLQSQCNGRTKTISRMLLKLLRSK